MIQGTASHAGKTVLVAAVCRILARAGYRVSPFKAQNMSLNSYVTPDGREIARAQALQAFAAGVEPRCEMNPILLKPKGGTVSQIVLMGRPFRDISFADYYKKFALNEGKRAVKASLKALLSEFDVIVIEGAGSPVEINLYDREIANMTVARLARAPVLLVADIDRGGVFASILGTMALLKPKDQERVNGLIINKFRGDTTILEPGLRKLKKLTGKPILGVMPYVDGLDLPWEDSVSLEGLSTRPSGTIAIAVIKLPFISNFTDIHPLIIGGVHVYMAKSARELRNPDAVIIPGTKNAVHDLLWLKKKGLDSEILRLRKDGVPIIGICGGYQILGKKLIDPFGLEGGNVSEYEGLDLLQVVSTFSRYEKTTRRVTAEVRGKGPILKRVTGRRINAYEIHMGKTSVVANEAPFQVLSANSSAASHREGAISKDGVVFGSYLHGLFDDEAVTYALLSYLAEKKGISVGCEVNMNKTWRESLDLLCRTVSANIDVPRILQIAGLKTKANESWNQSTPTS
jgi:adenosylcobyric acid synthase